MALIYCDGDNEVGQARAREAAEFLVEAYPNHSWWVECKGGALIIKHFEVSGARGNIGMVRHLAFMEHDAKGRKKDIIRAAGEMLERAGLRRGARTEDPVTHFEMDDKRMEKHWQAPLLVIPTIH